MATCKQIRQELFAIYLTKNQYVFEVDDFDGAWTSSSLKVLCQICTGLGFRWCSGWPEDVQSRYDYSAVNVGGSPNWQNLSRWLEACYKG